MNQMVLNWTEVIMKNREPNPIPNLNKYHLSTIDVWNGKMYHTDHWYISYANGGFTCAFNAQVLKAKTNQKNLGPDRSQISSLCFN